MKILWRFYGPKELALFVVLPAVILVAPACARDFTLEEVLGSPFPSELVASEHAARVAWVFDSHGRRNIWVAEAPDFQARQLTQYGEDDGEPIASLRITPDGRTAVFVRGSEVNQAGRVADPTSGMVRRKQLVLAIDVDGEGPRMLGEMGCDEEDCEDLEISPDGQFAVWSAKDQLWIAPVSGATPAHQLTELSGKNQSPRWSPDGHQIAFVSDRGDHSFIAVLDFGRNSVRYLGASVDRDGSPRWSPDGNELAFLRIPGRELKQPLIPIPVVPWSIFVADLRSGRTREIWHSGHEPNDSFPELTADSSFFFAANDHLVFASEADGWNHLYSISTSGGGAVRLTSGEFDVEDVRLSPDRQSVVFSSNEGDIDRRHLWRVALPEGTPQPLTRGETIEWAPVEVVQGNNHFLLCLGSTATTPAMPYVISQMNRRLLAGSALGSDFPSAQLVTPKPVLFRSEDGLEIHGQLFIPKGRTTAGPALIFLHGGPIRQMVLGFHYMDYYHNAYAMNEYLASRGYVVLSVNYRLGIMYGRAFREPADGSWRGSSEYKDVLAGAKYLASLATVDRNKIGLWGGSYGGLLTALGLARNSDVFRAGVDFHGVHDWSVFLPRGQSFANPPDREAAERLAFASSPDAAVATWKSPVLLIQGDDDRNVPFSQTVDLVQRLRQNHVPFEQLVLPDEIHGFLMWKSWVRAYSATAEFFDRTMKQGQPIGGAGAN